MKKLAGVFVLCTAAAATAADGYHAIKKIHIGGPTGWDYATMDSSARRLYISNSTRVVVLDVDSGNIAGEIPDTQGVHGIAVAPGPVRVILADTTVAAFIGRSNVTRTVLNGAATVPAPGVVPVTVGAIMLNCRVKALPSGLPNES